MVLINKSGAKKLLDSVLILALIVSMLYIAIFVIAGAHPQAQQNVSLAVPANNTVFTNTTNLNFTCWSTLYGNETAFANASLYLASTLISGTDVVWSENTSNRTALTNATNTSIPINMSSTGSQDGNWTWNCYFITTNTTLSSTSNNTGNFSYVNGNRTFILDTQLPSITLNTSAGAMLGAAAGNGSRGANQRNISLNCTPSTQSTYSIRNVTLWMNGTSGNVNGTSGPNATWKAVAGNQSIVSNKTMVNFTINNTVEGNYTWTCDIEDSSPGNNVSVAANRTVIVDATVPTNITINSPVNNTNLSTSTLNLNWSAVDNVYTYTTCSITVDGIAQTGDLANVVTQNGTSTINSINRTITGLSNADHTVNVTCNDGNSNSNTSATFKISVDAGSASLSLTPSVNTNLALGQSLSVSCDASSVTSITSTSLTVGGENKCTGITSCSGTYTASGTGDKTMTCTATNSAGISTSKSITLSVSVSGATSTSTGGGGGGGGTPTEPTTTEAGQTADVSTVSTTTSLGANENINIVVDGISSTLTVTSVGIASATASMAGETISLVVGQSQTVDLNDDGTDDVKVTLNSIKNGEANYEIKKAEAKVPTKVTPAVTPVVSGEEVTEKAKLNTLWITLAAIVIIIIAVGAYLLTRKSKVGRNKQYRP